MESKEILLANIDKLHTTEIGIDNSQNKYIGNKLTYLMYKSYKRY